MLATKDIITSSFVDAVTRSSGALMLATTGSTFDKTQSRGNHSVIFGGGEGKYDILKDL